LPKGTTGTDYLEVNQPNDVYWRAIGVVVFFFFQKKKQKALVCLAESQVRLYLDNTGPEGVPKKKLVKQSEKLTRPIVSFYFQKNEVKSLGMLRKKRMTPFSRRSLLRRFAV
jgi:hypothetical protein